MPRAPFHLDAIRPILRAHGEMRQADLAKAAELTVGTLIAAVRPGLRSGELRDRRDGRSVFYRLAEHDKPQVVGLPPSAPSASVNGYVPPQMIAPRAGSEVRLPSRAPGAAPAASASPEMTNPPPAPKPSPIPAPAPSVETSVGNDESAAGADETVEARPFEAWLSGVSDELVLQGVHVDEDGDVTLSADQVAVVRRLLLAPGAAE